jgi:MscS family membrane protein
MRWEAALRQNPQHDGIRLILLGVLLCLGCGASAMEAQAVPAAVKKATGGKTQHPSAASAAAPAAATQAAAPTPPPEPADPLGRTTPQGSVLGFLKAAEADDYKKAAKYLDGKRSDEQGQELATQLKTLLDLGMSTSIESLSRSPEGNTKDNLRVSRELVGTVKTEHGDLDIFLDQVTRKDQPPIWLFSQETLKEVPAAYASVQHRDFSRHFPEWMLRVRFLSVPIWRWVMVLSSGLIILALASILTRVLIWLLRTLLRRRRLNSNVEAGVLRLRGPIFGLMLALVLHWAAGNAMTALARHYWELMAVAVAWVSGAWLLARLTDIFVAYERTRALMQMQVERATFIGLLGRFFKILVGFILVVVVLHGAGVDVSALIAGLGIGGVALALAAQSTLSDLFGGISVVARGAVRVGDFCQIDGIQGTVEDIGISSLSLRTLDRTLVSIPNSKVAQVKLENFALRDQFWLHHVFTLQFDTPSKVLKAILDRFIEVLVANSEIDKSSARARLINLTAAGPQIEVFAYFRRPGADSATFLGEQEKILLKMMSIVESEGASMSAPVSVVQLKQEKKSDGSVDSAAPSV